MSRIPEGLAVALRSIAEPRSRFIATPAGPAVLTCEPFGSEEIQFRPQLAERPTRRDARLTLALAATCRPMSRR